MAYKKKSNFFTTLFKLLLLIVCVAALIGGGVYLYNYVFENESSISLYINNSKVTTYTGNKLEQTTYTFTLVGADSDYEYSLSFKPIGSLFYYYQNSTGNTTQAQWYNSIYDSSSLNPTINNYFNDNELISYYSNSFTLDLSETTIETIIEYYRSTYISLVDGTYNEDTDYIQLTITGNDDTTFTYQFNIVDFLIRFEETNIIF